MQERNKKYTFEDVLAMLPEESEKTCIIDKFLSALELVKTTKEFKTVDMQRYLKCGYSDTCRVIDALVLLGVAEELAESIPGGKYKVKNTLQRLRYRDATDKERTNLAEITIASNTFGKVDKVYLNWDSKCMKFKSCKGENDARFCYKKDID